MDAAAVDRHRRRLGNPPAKAEIAGLKQDWSHEARTLEIAAFEAETKRMQAVGVSSSGA